MLLDNDFQKPETGARPEPSPSALGKAPEQSEVRAPLRAGETVSRRFHTPEKLGATPRPATVRHEKKLNMRASTKAPRVVPPRVSLSVNAVALALCVFFVFAVLASCIAANDRAGDAFVPRELK
jgi:hypothetical protein